MRSYLFYILLIFGISFASDCTDSMACNYNPDAIIDDGSCIYPIECPDNSLECDVNDCIIPNGFDWEGQSKLFFLFVDYAYKFNSNFPLTPYEDWIAGFKIFDETQDGTCEFISENCPDINSDGLLTDNVEFCVGSTYWNGENDSEIPLMGFDGDPMGYLEPGDQPYFKLFDSETDSLYFMLPYKNGDQFEVIYSGNSQIEIMQIDSLVAQCPFYNNYDTDNDSIPDTCDACPNDSDNDIDGDGICGNVDICPNDFHNDIDGDGICGDIDDCPNDSDNDSDGDGICGDIDDCPNDAENLDIDNDGVCDDIDECIGEYDECGICNGDGTWCLTANISIGLVYNQNNNQVVVEILYDSPLSIGGFQLSLSEVNILYTSGGAAADAGFNIAHNNNTIVAFSPTGNSISPGAGLLTNIYVEVNGSQTCLYDVVLSDDDGDQINAELGSCKLLPCIDDDNDSLCNYEDICPNDSDNDIDGDGICGDIDDCPNDAENDSDGDGICGDIDEYPDCFDNFYDCFGICGGDAIIDECGICDGTGNCECPDFPDGVIPDCNGICDGGAFLDDCGICSEGDTNHDANSDIDCNGDCFGIAFEDDCEICSDGNTNHEANSDKDCAGVCFGDSEIDQCNVCGGDNSTCADCHGTPNGEAELDSCGVCSGGLSDHEADSDIDCNGDCFGEAFIDDCGVCSGGNSGHDENIEIDDCGICFGENQDMDCNGVCFGDGIDLDNDNICDDIDECIGEYDECGICNGDGTWCLDANIEFGSLSETHLDILYDSPLDIGGFQFSISGINIINAFGGATSESGFNIANNNDTVLAFSLTNDTIPAGSGILVTITIEYISPEACFYNVVFSDIDGDEINVNIAPCIEIPCENQDMDDICDNIDDCFGTVDDCGICNGNSDTCLGCTDLLACNYNQDAIIDDQSCIYAEGSCDCNDNPIENYCNCEYDIEDCWGDCGGTAYLDYCGDCVGGNSPYEEGFLDLGCDCHNPAPLIYCEDTDGDGLGNIGSDTEYCLEESEGNQHDILPDGWVEDCSDECPDDIENDLDQDGVCESDEVFGCSDNLACNYDDSITEDDGSCIYLEINNLLPIDNQEFSVDNSNIGDSIQFSWSIPDINCGSIDFYKLSIFDELLAPILDRVTTDTSFLLPFSDLGISDSTINNYYWNIYLENEQELDFESTLFSFMINAEHLNIKFKNIPSNFSLSEAYPNPFNPNTSFDYSVPHHSKVRIHIYDSLGRIVDKPINKFHNPGIYSFIWIPNNLSSGIYYVQLISSQTIINRKIIYLK